MLTSFRPFEQLAGSLLPPMPIQVDGAHDLSHLVRVWRNASAIQRKEGGDLEIVAAAVLLHDCVSVSKASPLRAHASSLAAEEARVRLQALSWEQSRIDAVASAIKTHSFSAGFEPTSLEGRILQDADRLDAIGLVGIARCFYTAGVMGSQLYEWNDPAAEGRPLDDRRYALDHFPAKLLTLTGTFKTATGEQLALDRHRQLSDFYTGILKELEP